MGKLERNVDCFYCNRRSEQTEKPTPGDRKQTGEELKAGFWRQQAPPCPRLEKADEERSQPWGAIPPLAGRFPHSAHPPPSFPHSPPPAALWGNGLELGAASAERRRGRGEVLATLEEASGLLLRAPAASTWVGASRGFRSQAKCRPAGQCVGAPPPTPGAWLGLRASAVPPSA